MEEFLRKTHKIIIKYPKREVLYTFKEPTIYTLLLFQEYVRDEEYIKAVQQIVDISELDIQSNPIWIINGIMQSLQGEKKSSWEQIFFPAVIDFIWKRYGNPMEVLKTLTYSQLLELMNGMEYNMNIENGEVGKNYKFRKKKRISDEKMREYEEILREVDNLSRIK